LGGLWELEWAWHIAETNLSCVRSSGICMPNLNRLDLIVSEISAFIRTDRQTDSRTWLDRLGYIKNIFTLWGRKRFLLPVTYFPTNIVYPFTLRVTGIKRKSNKVETPLDTETRTFSVPFPAISGSLVQRAFACAKHW